MLTVIYANLPPLSPQHALPIVGVRSGSVLVASDLRDPQRLRRPARQPRLRAARAVAADARLARHRLCLPAPAPPQRPPRAAVGLAPAGGDGRGAFAAVPALWL